MMRKPFARSAFNYDTDEVSERTGLSCEGDPEVEKLTRQEFKEEVDINTILRRFNLTGELPQGVRVPTYGDFLGVTDFHSAANAIALAHEAFDQMPADVRSRFGNDAGAFVDFCSDEKNKDEMRRMGLLVDEPQRLHAPPNGPTAPAGGPAPSAAGSSSSNGITAPAAVPGVGTVST